MNCYNNEGNYKTDTHWKHLWTESLDSAFYKRKHLLSTRLPFMHRLKCDCHPAIRSLAVFLHNITKTHSLPRKQFSNSGDDLQKHLSANVSHRKWSLQIKLNIHFQLDFCHHDWMNMHMLQLACWLTRRMQSWQNTCVQLYLLKRCCIRFLFISPLNSQGEFKNGLFGLAPLFPQKSHFLQEKS